MQLSCTLAAVTVVFSVARSCAALVRALERTPAGDRGRRRGRADLAQAQQCSEVVPPIAEHRAQVVHALQGVLAAKRQVERDERFRVVAPVTRVRLPVDPSARHPHLHSPELPAADPGSR